MRTDSGRHKRQLIRFAFKFPEHEPNKEPLVCPNWRTKQRVFSKFFCEGETKLKAHLLVRGCAFVNALS